ncbi:MAG: chorismate synthase [Promethearchaeota archaeon]
MTFSFGKEFKMHVFGESHGELVGVTVEGCTPGLVIDTKQIQRNLDLRRPGASDLSTTRSESDTVMIRSGVFQGRATGAPITMTIPNLDVDSSSYEQIRSTPRPGHADYTSRVKYDGFNDYRGGGVFSGRMTAAFVMAGSLAKTMLQKKGIEVLAHTVQVGAARVSRVVTDQEIRTNVYSNAVRCAAEGLIDRFEESIEQARKDGDSVGGVVECRVLGVPVGYGEPLFDSVESVMSHAMFSIPGVKGIEFGSGFRGTELRGSENNDPIILRDKGIGWAKNDAGGILGGITNGAPIVFRVAIKPTSSISREQSTVNLDLMEETTLTVQGRHDPCIVPRAVPVIEGLAAVVMNDLVLRSHTKRSASD